MWRYLFRVILLALSLFLAVTVQAQVQNELKVDDGTFDGKTILQNGAICVNRLTPNSYPAALRSIRILFEKSSKQSDPVGKTVRLIVFADILGKGQPRTNPHIDFEKIITIPSTGEFVDFSTENLIITSGDLYIGYQVLDPVSGVGFACDTNSPPQQRGFFSTNNGASFQPLRELPNGTTLNLMIRAITSEQINVGPHANLELSFSSNPVAAVVTGSCDGATTYWPFNVTLTETENVGITIKVFRKDFFDSKGNKILTVSEPDTFIAENFADEFGNRGSFISPSSKRVASLCTGLKELLNGGAIVFTISGSDSFGNTEEFTSPQLIISPAPPNSGTPVISSVKFDRNRTLKIIGNGFSSGVKVLVNNSDRSSFVKSLSVTNILLKGKPAKLGIIKGANSVQVIDANGNASQIVTFNF